MATQQPQSTISYNSPEFLQEKLSLLYDEHLIQSYQYIFHHGEDGDKDHFHLRIVPNKRLDMMEIKSFFSEPDLLHPDKPPLGVLDWGLSKQDDWLLYAIHDPEYMRLKYPADKCEKIPYSEDSVVCSPGFPLSVSFARARAAMVHMQGNILSQISSGADPRDLIAHGTNASLVRTIMSVVYTYHSHKDFEKLENDFQREAFKAYQLEQYLLSLGFVSSYDRDCHLTIEKIYDNIEKGDKIYEK